ncbi:hypothetical protein [Spirillospora sp. CA-128828]
MENEGARLVQAVDPHVKGALAALTDAAELATVRRPVEEVLIEEP